MANEPDYKNVTERKQNSPTREMKSASAIIKETSGAIKELSTVYERIGLAGTFTVSAIVLGILTIVFSYFSGAEIGNDWRLGTSLHEEILFGCIVIAFAGLGTVSLIYRNSKESQRELLAMEIERELNRYIHEEAIAKLQLPGSTKEAQTTQAADPNGRTGLSDG